MDLTYLVLIGALFGLIGAAIGRRKNRVVAGFIFGFILGPLGWLIVLLGPDYRPEAVKSGGKTANDLLQLKALLDAGAITQSEYDAKKKVLVEKL